MFKKRNSIIINPCLTKPIQNRNVFVSIFQQLFIALSISFISLFTFLSITNYLEKKPLVQITKPPPISSLPHIQVLGEENPPNLPLKKGGTTDQSQNSSPFLEGGLRGFLSSCHNCIRPRHLKDNSIDSKKIQNKSITSSDIASNQINSRTIQDGAIQSVDLSSQIELEQLDLNQLTVGQGSPSHFTLSSGDAYIQDNLEVDGDAFFDQKIYVRDSSSISIMTSSTLKTTTANISNILSNSHLRIKGRLPDEDYFQIDDFLKVFLNPSIGTYVGVDYNDIPTFSNIDGQGDLFIQDDLEVQGIIYGTISGSFAPTGNLDMDTNLITNIGNANTDFTTSGGLNLASNLNVTGTITATAGNSTNWNTAYGWGNHASYGYITDGNTLWDNSYGFITASSADTLTNKSGNISMWTNDSGYLTSYTETDPVYSAWNKSTGISITESQISNLQNYLTSYTETDPIYLAWDKSTGISITESQISNLQNYIFDGNTNWNNEYGFITNLSSFTTDNLTQGTTNLYSQWATSGTNISFSGGNVGIGTTVPNFILDVNGIINSTGLYVNGSPYIGSQWTTSETTIYYNSGNVGIGTTAPSAGKLQIAGGSIIAGYFSSTNDNQITLNSLDSWTGIGFDDSGTINDYLWYTGVNGTFALGGGGSNVSGKKLHVDGGMTIGANYDATAVATNGLTVEGNITTAGTFNGAGTGLTGTATSLNIGGNAATVSNFTSNPTRSDGGDYSLAGRTSGLYAIANTGTNGPGATYLSLIHAANGTDVAFQIAGGYVSDAMYFRGTSALQNGTSYTPWRTVIHSGNIGSQSVATANNNVLKSGDTMSGNLNFNNYGLGMYGTYSSTVYQNVFSMGAAYGPTSDGSSLSNMYGIAWTHTNVGGQSKPGLSHQALFVSAGVTQTAIGTGIWTNGTVTAPIYSGTVSGSSYGSIKVSGTTGSYAGTYYSDASGSVGGMFDTAGNGGDYDPTTGWHFYWLRSNASLGIGGSQTYAGYKAVINGNTYGMGNGYFSGALSASGDVNGYDLRASHGNFYSGTRTGFFLGLQGDRNMVLYDNYSAIWTAGTGVSDINKKRGLVPLENSLAKFNEINAYSFYWKDELNWEKEMQLGVIAQEIEKVYPQFVYTDSKGDKLVYYDKLTVPLIGALKELNNNFVVHSSATKEDINQIQTDLSQLTINTEEQHSTLSFMLTDHEQRIQALEILTSGINITQPELSIQMQELDSHLQSTNTIDGYLFDIDGNLKVKKVEAEEVTGNNQVKTKQIKFEEKEETICDENNEGIFYYNKQEKIFYGCNGTTWKKMQFAPE